MWSSDKLRNSSVFSRAFIFLFLIVPRYNYKICAGFKNKKIKIKKWKIPFKVIILIFVLDMQVPI